ncbi:tetratricopeptide repeat protein [bacterium]|nr:MAG: tetratricopeptide repeat protein [bacterium]
MNITFIVSILGVIFMVLRRLPEATIQDKNKPDSKKDRIEAANEAGSVLSAKGLPVKAYSKSKVILKTIGHKAGQFLLEAKGLKQAPKITYTFQKVFQNIKADTNPALVKDEKYYINLIKRNPKDDSYYDLLGQYYLEHKKMEDALNVYEYLITHAPTETSYWVRLGLAALFLNNYKKAEQAYEKAVQLDPTNPSRFYNLALARQGMKRFAPALEAIKKALELDPNNQKYQDFNFELESKAKNSIPLDNIHKKE